MVLLHGPVNDLTSCVRGDDWRRCGCMLQGGHRSDAIQSPYPCTDRECVDLRLTTRLERTPNSSATRHTALCLNDSEAKMRSRAEALYCYINHFSTRLL